MTQLHRTTDKVPSRNKNIYETALNVIGINQSKENAKKKTKKKNNNNKHCMNLLNTSPESIYASKLYNNFA
jgi:hypothetical protein